jgi:hypothetical protein
MSIPAGQNVDTSNMRLCINIQSIYNSGASKSVFITDYLSNSTFKNVADLVEPPFGQGDLFGSANGFTATLAHDSGETYCTSGGKF